MFKNTFYSINHLNHQSYYPISENNEIKLSTFPIPHIPPARMHQAEKAAGMASWKAVHAVSEPSKRA